MLSLFLLLAVFLLLLLVVLVAGVKVYLYVTAVKCLSRARMDNKTVIITGGNAGIGRETALEIARRGARIILACRNLETANKVKDEIVEETKNRNVVVKKLDLASQKSIRAFAADVKRSEARLDVLLHNAGMSAKNVEMSEDDLEMTMATNLFGPFLLTHLLIDILKKSAPSRVVIVASEFYRLVSLNLEKLNPRRSWFPPIIYFHSKYADILFSNELARRLEGTGVTANCLHPGVVNTGIWSSAPALLSPFLKCITRNFFRTTKEGSETSTYVACAEELDGVTGKYFSDCKERGLNPGASDINKAKKMWELCESFAKLQPEDPKI